MLYSEQSPKQKLSSQTIETLEIIAQDSILGASLTNAYRVHLQQACISNHQTHYNDLMY